MFWNNRRKTRKKCKYERDMTCIKRELERFVSDCQSPFIICCDLDKRKVLRLLTNRPGLLIGKQGSDLKRLKEVLIKEGISIKKIEIYEINHMVSNNIIVANHLSLIDEVIK